MLTLQWVNSGNIFVYIFTTIQDWFFSRKCYFIFCLGNTTLIPKLTIFLCTMYICSVSVNFDIFVQLLYHSRCHPSAFVKLTDSSAIFNGFFVVVYIKSYYWMQTLFLLVNLPKLLLRVKCVLDFYCSNTWCLTWLELFPLLKPCLSLC